MLYMTYQISANWRKPFPSAHYVDALVSGLPTAVRGSRFLMILQAFIDDSKTNARRPLRVFTLGGLVASVDAWKAFSDEWSAKLQEPPGLDYFKLSQALSMRDQFDGGRGWTVELRNERVLDLAKIARRHALFGIGCALNQSLYEEFVATFSPFRDLKDPYFLCFYQIVDAITAARSLYPDATGLDYIFDEQGDAGLRAVEFWKRMKAMRKDELLGSTPVHRDDKCFKPLQAADLYAGLRRLEGDSGPWRDPLPLEALNVFADMQAWQRVYTKDDLMELARLSPSSDSGWRDRFARFDRT